MRGVLQVIRDGARRASLHMALDEVLLRRMREDASAGPVLRFYTWEKPAVTAGYFEDVARVAGRFRSDEKKLAVVRRLTGGGAVLHGEDLTFSLTMRLTSPLFPGNVKSSYLKINEAVRRGLQDRVAGIDYADCRTVPSQTQRQKERVCFESASCYDLLLNGRKILGGSQRRVGPAMLHQSTLFLPGDKDKLIEDILRGVRAAWGMEPVPERVDAEWLEQAERAEKARYSDAAWGYFPESVSFLPAWPAGRREAIFLS